MRFHFERVMAFVASVAPQAGQNGGDRSKLRDRLLELEVQEAEHDFAVKRGRYIDKARIDPVLAEIFRTLTDDLQQKFERELPMKCAGKTPVEIQAMNAAAIDWALTRLRAGGEPLRT